jgi:signal peptidase I
MRENMRPLIRESLQIILLALVVFFALHFLVQNFRVEGSSMEPNLHGGADYNGEQMRTNYVLVNKAAYWFSRGPSRGDVVVFQAPDQPETDRIKRVIGLPGETVEVRPDGSVLIDGELLHEPYLSPNQGGPSGTWVVPEDEYFVMGDNRLNSHDSRGGGPVPRANIVGKAWVVIWPLGDWAFAPNEAVAFESSS